MTATGPRFTHDSTCCTYLGSGHLSFCAGPAREHDFYYCPATGSCLARYGDEGPDYTSFGHGGYYQRSIIDIDPRYAEAYRRAVEAGHIDEADHPEADHPKADPAPAVLEVRMDLEPFMDAVFDWLEHNQDGGSGHTIMVRAADANTAAREIARRLVPLIADCIYKTNQERS